MTPEERKDLIEQWKDRASCGISLSQTLEWIAKHLPPQTVYSHDQLALWALDHGFVHHIVMKGKD